MIKGLFKKKELNEPQHFKDSCGRQLEITTLLSSTEPQQKDQLSSIQLDFDQTPELGDPTKTSVFFAAPFQAYPPNKCISSSQQPNVGKENRKKSQSYLSSTQIQSKRTGSQVLQKSSRVEIKQQHHQQFIDETQMSSCQNSQENFLLNQLKDQRAFATAKIRAYSSQLEQADIQQICRLDKAPSNGHLKAFRALCLVLKASTQLLAGRKEIKKEEVFGKWEKIQQYLRSQQGQIQVRDLKERIDFQRFDERVNKKAIEQLQQIIFAYTLDWNEIDLQSPRVKNPALKVYFSLAYFVWLFFKIGDMIQQEEVRVEEQLFSQSQIHETLAANAFVSQIATFPKSPQSIQKNTMPLLEQAVQTNRVKSPKNQAKPQYPGYQRQTISNQIKTRLQLQKNRNNKLQIKSPTRSKTPPRHQRSVGRSSQGSRCGHRVQSPTLLSPTDKLQGFFSPQNHTRQNKKRRSALDFTQQMKIQDLIKRAQTPSNSFQNQQTTELLTCNYGLNDKISSKNDSTTLTHLVQQRFDRDSSPQYV